MLKNPPLPRRRPSIGSHTAAILWAAPMLKPFYAKQPGNPLWIARLFSYANRLERRPALFIWFILRQGHTL